MEKGAVSEFKGKTLDEINKDMEEDLMSGNNEDEPYCLNIEPIENIRKNVNTCASVSHEKIDNNSSNSKNEKGKCPKKGRVLVKWTDEQKRIVSEFFAQHIKKKKNPKRAECEELKEKHKELLKTKDWLKIKVYVRNKYLGKCK